MTERRHRSRFGRAIATAKLGGSVATRYLGGAIADRLRNKEQRAEAEAARHVDAARRAARTLAEMRGPMLKIGQLLSTHAAALPGAWTESLSALQERVPAMPFEQVREVLARELGALPSTLFQSFDERALAAASLGQVHAATLHDGRRVAVKIQYPGVGEMVAADVANVRFGAGLGQSFLVDTLGRDGLDFSPVVEELAERLLEEADYCREAFHAKLFARLFRDDALVHVPAIHDDRSSLHVVTYDFIEGRPLDDALRDPSFEVRRRTVHAMTHGFWKQLFQGGFLHADPHPGNYRVLPDGRVALLDFGCVKMFDAQFLDGFRAMVAARLDRDDDALERAMRDLALVTPGASADELDDVMRISRYFSVGLDPGEFDFASFDYVAEVRALFRHFLGRRAVPPARKDFLFLTRVVLGYYEYFSRAGVCTDYRSMVEPFIRAPRTTLDFTPYEP